MPPFREHLNRDHVRSPYARASASPSAAINNNARTPRPSPGLFSRVKSMFSPKTWSRDDANSSVNSIGSAQLDDSFDNSLISNQSFLQSTHSNKNPLDEFRTMRRQGSIQQLRLQQYGNESPNVKLAKFFANKGAEPLSEVELEGVKALLTQTSKNSSPSQTPDNTMLTNHDGEDEFDHNDSMVLKPDTSSASLLSVTPSFKATYNDSMGLNDHDHNDDNDKKTLISSNPTPKRRVFDYSGFPSPYRSSRLKRSTFALNTEYEKAQKAKAEGENNEPKKEEKKLSNTASAFLSFIQNNTEDEADGKKSTHQDESSSDLNKKEVDFSNPYARTKKSSHHSVSKKPSPLEELEKTLQSQQEPVSSGKKQDEQKQQPQQAQSQTQVPSTMDKYKPAKSSSLRESITVANDDLDVEVDDEKDEEKKDDTTPAFGFGNSFGFTGLKKPDEPSAPKPVSFSFGQKEDAATEKITEKSKPAFSFGTSTTTNNKPAPSFGSVTSASSTTTNPFTFGYSTTSPPVSFNHTQANQEPSTITTTKDDDGDEDVKDESNLSLTVHPTKEINGTSNNHDSIKPSSFTQFAFPGAEDLGFTIKDVDESKVSVYRGLYTF